jgi:hypothetical protein
LPGTASGRAPRGGRLAQRADAGRRPAAPGGMPEQRRDKRGLGEKDLSPKPAGRTPADRGQDGPRGRSAATTTFLKGTGAGIPASRRVTDQRRGSASAGRVGSRSILTVCVGRRPRAGWKLHKGARFGPTKRSKEGLSRGPRTLKPLPRRPGHRGDRRGPARRPGRRRRRPAGPVRRLGSVTAGRVRPVGLAASPAASSAPPDGPAGRRQEASVGRAGGPGAGGGPIGRAGRSASGRTGPAVGVAGEVPGRGPDARGTAARGPVRRPAGWRQEAPSGGRAVRPGAAGRVGGVGTGRVRRVGRGNAGRLRGVSGVGDGRWGRHSGRCIFEISAGAICPPPSRIHHGAGSEARPVRGLGP